MIITKTIASIVVALSLLAGANSAFALAGNAYDYRATIRAMEADAAAALAAAAQDESKPVTTKKSDKKTKTR